MRQSDVIRANKHGHSHANERGKQTDLRPAQEKLVGSFLPDLICDPCLGSAGGKGVAQAPDDLRQQNGQEGREEAFHEEAQSHQHITDDDGQPARIHIRDNAGRHFEHERRDFQRCADKNELHRRQACHSRFIQRRDHEHHREERRGAEFDEEINEPCV